MPLTSARGLERNLRARVLALATLAVFVVAVIAVIATSGGGSGGNRPRATPTASPTATAVATASPAHTVRPARALSPSATVRAFYTRAAAGDYAGAWRLAGPGMRAAFAGSLERFRSDMSSLRRIDFQRLAVTQRGEASATVTIESVATHTDRVDRCSGTLRTVRSASGRWLVEPAGVSCTH